LFSEDDLLVRCHDCTLNADARLPIDKGQSTCLGPVFPMTSYIPLVILKGVDADETRHVHRDAFALK
jgi:hypothetical protein